MKLSQFFQKVGKFGEIGQLMSFYEIRVTNYFLIFLLILWLLRSAGFPNELETFVFVFVFEIEIEKCYEDRRGEKIKKSIETVKKSLLCQPYSHSPVISREEEETEANYYYHQHVVEKKRSVIQSLV
jgi:hypothetical protein